MEHLLNLFDICRKTSYFLQSLIKSLKSLHMETNEDEPLEKLMEVGLDSLAQVWRKRDGQSEVAFQVRILQRF